MAKKPASPKPKSDAPAQFDMNSRDRKGGRGGPGGSGRRGRDEKRPPSRIETLPPSLVDRGEGWAIWKIGKVDLASHAPAGADYQLIFEGHEPLVFSFLAAARERSKEPPPEKPQAEGTQAEPVAAEAPEGADVDDAAEAASSSPPADGAEPDKAAH